MKKVLILTYYWPPGTGPGVQRWLKFCKYLPASGWQPSVITVKNGSYPNTDPSLEDDVPSDLEVIKTNTFEPFGLYNMLRGKKGKSVEVGMGNIKDKSGGFSKLANYIRANFFIPDARLGWNRYSYPAAVKWIRQNNPDAIITTGPPHSTHLVGQQLKKDFNLPWIADFRDPWTTVYYNAYLHRTEQSRKRDKALEDSVLQSADRALVASKGMQHEFGDRTDRIVYLPNGFDNEDFTQAEDLEPPAAFTIRYVGNFKANQNVDALWQAIRQVHDQHPEVNLKIVITGNVHTAVEEGWKKQKLDASIEVEPFVPHADAINRMLRAHVLLLPIPHSEKSHQILTGKLFEYLACRRPILCVGPTDGDASEILQNCGHQAAIDYKDQSGIAQFLEMRLAQFIENPEPTRIDDDGYLQFSRAGITSQLVNVMNEMAEK